MVTTTATTIPQSIQTNRTRATRVTRLPQFRSGLEVRVCVCVLDGGGDAVPDEWTLADWHWPSGLTTQTNEHKKTHTHTQKALTNSSNVRMTRDSLLRDTRSICAAVVLCIEGCQESVSG